MRRELTLAGVVVLMLGGTAATATQVPGIVSQPTEPPEPPAELDIVEATVSTGAVTGSRATLRMGLGLTHRGSPAESVSVRYRAVEPDSELVVDRHVERVGTVTGTAERTVNGTLTVPREGEYELEAIVYENGTRVRSTRTRVAGLTGLRPDYARSDVRFHRFSGVGLPVVQYSIAAAGNRTALDVSTFLTNGGGDPVEDLRVTVYARQVDSNIVADRASMRIDRIGSGETVTPGAELTVPDEYNYYLEAVLWKDDVIVDTARSGAALAPRERVPENETVRENDVDVGEFDEETPTETAVAEETVTEQATEAGGQPGFGIVAAMVAAFAGLLAVRRWSA
ncbi:PGF-CTERM sorting domain-containing protein [Haloglomus irregulare]|jgi:PGF-CTERM protein|uniref:PGF-CTERM sorting domain-containing protein n=1 Tax=Haloglomus irregulare TaxID=2234134 RepID=A0A554NCF1_9EURY|nr:PGF-CTERM sorting domain-containing protein [Haloglomus irregulare]TSD15069.1 PGF-CTERM sorting domain-containing protein [Haloglomus irregulare]